MLPLFSTELNANIDNEDDEFESDGMDRTKNNSDNTDELSEVDKICYFF